VVDRAAGSPTGRNDCGWAVCSIQ